MSEILRVLGLWFIFLNVSCDDFGGDTIINRLIVSVIVIFIYNILKNIF